MGKQKEPSMTEASVAATVADNGANGHAPKSPFWTTHSNRVSGSIWRHDQKGKSRYTVAISRSYYDQKAGEWKRVHFYDRQDLDDVIKSAQEAKSYLAEVMDKVDAV